MRSTKQPRTGPRRNKAAVASLLSLLIVAPASAQLSILRSSIDAGGGQSSGGSFGLGGTIGQPDAGLHSSRPLRLGGGFWFGGSGTVVGIDDAELPEGLPSVLSFALHATHPNPFNPATTIAFDLPEPSRVELRIYNLRGELVSTLVEREMPAGRHSLSWRGRDGRGALVASGVYILKLAAGPHSARQKITLVR
jgi:hypothetical protein